MNFRLSRRGFFEEAPSYIPCYTNGANPQGLQFYKRERFSECRRAARMPHACLSVMDDMIKLRDIALFDSPLKKWWQFFLLASHPLSQNLSQKSRSHGRSHWRWHRNQTRLKPWIKPQIVKQLGSKLSQNTVYCRKPRSPNDMLAIGGPKSLWVWSPDNGGYGFSTTCRPFFARQ